jgi:calcium/proton exchanger cax
MAGNWGAGHTVLMATKNRMDLALSITVGSSIQIALFVAPVLVLASYLIAPHPMIRSKPLNCTCADTDRSTLDGGDKVI